MARVTRVEVTPFAFRDPPLLNAVGVHEPYALRSVVQVHTDGGVTGLGESYGDLPHLSRLRRAAEELVGTALLHAAVGWARNVGVHKLELHVFPYNEGAIALYEQFGFRREGYRHEHYRRA